VALQQTNHHVAAISAGVPELKPLRDQSPLFGAMDRPAVLGTDCPRTNLDRAVGPQVTKSDARRLGDAQAGIEEEQEDRLVAGTRSGEKLAELVVVQRLDELARYAGLYEPADGCGLGELFGREPVAEHMQAADVARNAHRRQGGAKLDEPSAPGRRFDLVEDRIGSEACDRPAKDVAIPAHRSGRQSFGFLRVAEQLHGMADLKGPRSCCRPANRHPNLIPIAPATRIRCPAV